MKKYCFVLICTLFALVPDFVVAQAFKFTGPWKFDVGPAVAIPRWSFTAFNSAGFGVDASASSPVSILENLYVGGRVYVTHFLPKKELGFIYDDLFRPANLIGIVADAHYLHQEKFVVGGNVGLGLRFPAFFGTGGLARSVYVGYQMPVGSRAFTIALNLNRTTLATWNLGLRGSFSL